MSIPLRQAVLCVDCEQISAPKGPNCEACGSSAVIGLARVLGSITPNEAARLVDFDHELFVLTRETRNQKLEAALRGRRARVTA